MLVHSDKLRWLAWLRLKMLVRGAQRNPRSLIWTVIGFVFVLAVAAGVAFVLYISYLGLSRPANTELLYLVFTGMLFFWIVLPLLSYSTNEGLDVTKLQLFPLTRLEVMFSLLFSSLFDIWTVFLFVLLGVTVAAWWIQSPAVGLMTLLVLVVFYITLVSISQLVLALLMRTLQSRRFRDFSIIILALFSSSCYIISRVASGANNILSINSLLHHAGFSPYLQWLPSGVAASAVRAAFQGNWGASLAFLVVLALICALALYLWQMVLERSMTASESSASRRSRQHRTGAVAVAGISQTSAAALSVSPAVASPARRAPAAANSVAVPRSQERVQVEYDPLKANLFEQLWALVKKEWICFWRDPQLKVRIFQIGIYVVIFVLFPAFNSSKGEGSTGGFLGSYPPFVSVAVVFFTMLTLCQNTLGMERQSLTALFLFPIDRKRLLWGKNLAIAVMGLALLVILMVVNAFLGHAQAMILPATIIGLAGMGIALGWGNFSSVYFPRYQRAMGRVYQATGGQAQSGGCMNSVMSLVMMLVTVVTLAPVALGIGIPFFLNIPLILAATIPLSLVYGGILYVVLTNLSARRMLATEPEILAVTTRE